LGDSAINRRLMSQKIHCGLTNNCNPVVSTGVDRFL